MLELAIIVFSLLAVCIIAIVFAAYRGWYEYEDRRAVMWRILKAEGRLAEYSETDWE